MPALHPNSPEAALLATDFYSFVRAVFPIVSGGHCLMANWHLQAIAYHLSLVAKGKIKRLIITVPPRSLKSIQASVAFPAFLLGQDPTRRIICVSYADDLAKKHANDFRAVMRSDVYRALFPRTRVSPAKDTESEVMTTSRGFRLTTSVLGTLTGRGANFIIIDDPLKPKDAHSAVARSALQQWYANTLLSRLDNKSSDAIVVVMQRLHLDDLVGHLLEQGGWTHLNLPAIAETECRIPLRDHRVHTRKMGELLHPEREDKVTLDNLKREMGSMDFAAQSQQAPVPSEGGLIKWSWFNFYETPPVAQPGDKLIVSWDTALSSSELADYSACVVLLARKGTIYLLDVLRQRLGYPELKRAVLEQHRRWRHFTNNYALIVEKMGSGLSLIQDLTRENIHAIGIKPEGDKVMRMAAQAAPIEAGAVHLPKYALWLDEFRKEVSSFPQSKHNDQIDALSQAMARAFEPDLPTAVFGVYGMGGRS